MKRKKILLLQQVTKIMMQKRKILQQMKLMIQTKRILQKNRILQKKTILMYHLLLLIQLLIQVVGRTMVSVVEQLLKKTMMMREKMIQIITHGFLKMMRKMNLKPMKHQLLIQQVQYH